MTNTDIQTSSTFTLREYSDIRIIPVDKECLSEALLRIVKVIDEGKLILDNLPLSISIERDDTLTVSRVIVRNRVLGQALEDVFGDSPR